MFRLLCCVVGVLHKKPEMGRRAWTYHSKKYLTLRQESNLLESGEYYIVGKDLPKGWLLGNMSTFPHIAASRGRGGTFVLAIGQLLGSAKSRDILFGIV